MARHHGEGVPVWTANVECSDDAIYAAGRNDGLVVLVPIVGEDFGGGCTGIRGRAMDGDVRDEVMCGGGRGTQIEESKMGV